MKFDDPRAKRVDELITAMFLEVREIDRSQPDLCASAKMRGFLAFFIHSLYINLEDGNRFEDYFVSSLERFIEELGEEAVMEKLKS